MQDPSHPDHADTIEWLPVDFDPEVFNADETAEMMPVFAAATLRLVIRGVQSNSQRVWPGRSPLTKPSTLLGATSNTQASPPS